MTRRSVLCYAHGIDSEWEAICVDLDIAVQGRSFDEVKRLLDDAIHSYVEDVCAEDEVTAARLLYRRAPLWVRARHRLAHSIARLSGRAGKEREFTAGVELPCPA